jgi:hypothetical protein
VGVSVGVGVGVGGSGVPDGVSGGVGVWVVVGVGVTGSTINLTICCTVTPLSVNNIGISYSPGSVGAVPDRRLTYAPGTSVLDFSILTHSGELGSKLKGV